MSKGLIIINKTIDYIEGKSKTIVNFFITANGESLNGLSLDDLSVLRNMINDVIKDSEGKQ